MNNNSSVKCPKCLGDGELACTNCHGAGVIDENQTRCRSCNGEGTQKCSDCKGKGFID